MKKQIAHRIQTLTLTQVIEMAAKEGIEEEQHEHPEIVLILKNGDEIRGGSAYSLVGSSVHQEYPFFHLVKKGQ